MFIEPRVKRITFASLAGVAVLALVIAIVAIVVPFAGIQWWLIACLVVLILVLAAEAALLLMDRPKRDKEAYEFVIGDDDKNEAR